MGLFDSTRKERRDYMDMVNRQSLDQYSEGGKNVSIEANINVTENRAPTDDSISLLREMEEKARKSVVASYTVEDNVLSGAILVLNQSPMDNGFQVYFSFTLNGKEYQSNIKLRNNPCREEVCKMLYEKVAEAVTSELVQAAIADKTLGLP